MNPEFSKPQYIRLWDVFAVGPLLIYSGMRGGKLPAPARVALVGTGVLTIIFNGRNFLLQRELEKTGQIRAVESPIVRYIEPMPGEN